MKLRFGLRALFVVMVMASATFSWWAHAARWVHARRQLLIEAPVRIFPHERSECPWAPGGLWILGERGVKDLWMMNPSDDVVTQAARLYPEAAPVIFRGGGTSLPEWFKDMRPYD